MVFKEFEMSQKTVLITGCSRGLGLGLVKEYISMNFKVLATCRNPGRANDLQTVLSDANQTEAFSLDVSDPASVQACKDEVIKSGVDKIDVLVNNAGISNKDHPDDPASKTDTSEFNFVMQTNVTGVLATTNAFLPLLKKSQDAKVINISSLLGSMSASPR